MYDILHAYLAIIKCSYFDPETQNWMIDTEMATSMCNNDSTRRSMHYDTLREILRDNSALLNSNNREKYTERFAERVSHLGAFRRAVLPTLEIQND